MAQMNRNLNLEEINCDAPLGIPYLMHQSLLQKIIFWGSVILAVGINLFGNIYLHINANIVVALTLIPLSIGVALGCNYNEDLSLVKYLVLILSKPTKFYRTKPMDDVQQLRASAKQVEEEIRLKNKSNVPTPEEQRRLLITLLLGILIFVAVLISVLVIINCNRTEEIHHTAKMLEVMLENEA